MKLFPFTTRLRFLFSILMAMPVIALGLIIATETLEDSLAAVPVAMIMLVPMRLMIEGCFRFVMNTGINKLKHLVEITQSEHSIDSNLK